MARKSVLSDTTNAIRRNDVNLFNNFVSIADSSSTWGPVATEESCTSPSVQMGVLSHSSVTENISQNVATLFGHEEFVKHRS